MLRRDKADLATKFPWSPSTGFLYSHEIISNQTELSYRFTASLLSGLLHDATDRSFRASPCHFAAGEL
jgi:hypothetical protein